MNASHSKAPVREKAFDFQLSRRVEFCDTDMAGIMHFSNYFRFMEATETAFLRSLGLSVLLSRCGLEVCLPRVHAECDYSDPLAFEDEVLVHLLVERKGTCSLTYQFRFYRLSGTERKQVARGRLILASAARHESGSLRAVPLPKAFADKIQQAPAQILAQDSPAGKGRHGTRAPVSKNGRADQETKTHFGLHPVNQNEQVS